MQRKIVLIVSLVAGLIAALLTRAYLTVKENEIKAEKSRLVKKYGTIEVLVFNHDIPGGTVLSKKDIGALDLPAMGLRGQALTRENYNDIIGRRTTTGHKQREVVFWSDIEGGDPSTRGLSADVKRQMRAMSINVNGSASVSGMINPNDHVDVIGTFNFPDDDGKIKRGDPVTCTILQNVLVLATGRDTSKSQTRELGMRLLDRHARGHAARGRDARLRGADQGAPHPHPQEPQRHVLREGAPAGRLPEDPPGDGGPQPEAPAQGRRKVGK